MEDMVQKISPADSAIDAEPIAFKKKDILLEIVDGISKRLY